MLTASQLTDTSSAIETTFAAQRQHARQMAQTTATQRIERIRRILHWIESHEAAIQQAMFRDFRKPALEVTVSELLPLYAEINHVLRNLKHWTRPQRVPTSFALTGTRSYIRLEPKGNVLIMAPWNYPFALLIRPLVLALAAGNVVILKPSELTPHTATLIQTMITELFPRHEVAVFDGDATLAQALLEQPFNHIFFTGSPAVGKIVMAAAARHLASVTLELGGKSPVIIDETANLKQAATQLAWGKTINNGQTCIAPDYLFIQASVKQPFLDALQKRWERMFNQEGVTTEQSPHYARIVNRRHFDRVKSLLDDALAKGARVVLGGHTNEAQHYIEPTVLEGVTNQMRIMQEEIFGPLFPVIPFTHIDDALAHINQGEKPLALYIHSRQSANIQYILNNTTAGDTVINESLIQYGNVEIPFGGVNNSGIGKTNGFFGFKEFSNQRSVMKREFGTMQFLYPPYTPTMATLIKWIKKIL